MILIFISNFEKKIHDLYSNCCSKRHELPIDSVENGFQVVSLSRILRVKEIKHLFNEGVCDVHGYCLRRNELSHNKLQKKFIDKLKMRPCFLKMRFIFIWINWWWLFICYETVTTNINNLLLFVKVRKMLASIILIDSWSICSLSRY